MCFMHLLLIMFVTYYRADQSLIVPKLAAYKLSLVTHWHITLKIEISKSVPWYDNITSV